MTQRKSRLGADDWILAGFRALAERGPTAIKAEALARDLGATKGSFYWHFKDVAALRDRMLSYWEARAFDNVAAQLQPISDPAERLRALGSIAAGFRNSAYGGAGTEPALRGWALSDKIVEEAVLRIDQRRLDYLQDLLAELGLGSAPMARAIYATYLGLDQLASTDTGGNTAAITALTEQLLNSIAAKRKTGGK